MRKITFDSINAFMSGKEFSRGNTKVVVNNAIGVAFLCLHGNEIASKCLDTGKIRISDAGWPTATTKDRLNGIPDVSIRQKNYAWYLNGKPWDGRWTEIK